MCVCVFFFFLRWLTNESSEELFPVRTTPVALVLNLDVIKSDYYNEFAKIIYEFSLAATSNTQILEWECDAQTDCATEPQIPFSLLPYIFY